MRITAVLCVRNEGAFLLEWLAHHRACGITDFLVFSNDCDDGTDAMLDRLEALGWLSHIRNPGPHPEGPQWSALKRADRHPLVTGADWLLPLDIDEFVNVHVGDRTIPDLLAALPEATAITLTWRLFGNAGVVRFEDAPVTETFTRAAPKVLYWPWRASLFKTLVRNDGSYCKLGVHRPRAPVEARMAGQRWFDGSGRALPTAFHQRRIFSDMGQDNHALVQLNHYPLGAVESFLLKRDRGRAVHADAGLDAGYWIERNFDTEEDRTILALDSRALRDDLRRDQALGAMHAAAVAWRHARFHALMRHDTWRSLYGQLLMAGPARVLTREEAESIWRPHIGRSLQKG
ncbi:glycosyltransferase family 2 protein [Rhodobacter calidifons]|uniref:Glycosyltransferase family 2 protein n=1 Tax=Rhodobacter calidifons TaxID=2715277 RepID=A0ABX0G7S9_9RHOB|nr:glycosyltransferase family 2 protein [Rhodobacter calidifons]NHB76918.1 glycosyltransferase family 2 protein [Rhodobacter calidifons]